MAFAPMPTTEMVQQFIKLKLHEKQGACLLIHQAWITNSFNVHSSVNDIVTKEVSITLHYITIQSNSGYGINTAPK